MSAEFQDNPSPARWRAAPTDRRHPPSPALFDWLTDAGLLTPRLRRASPQGFRLQLLQHGPGTLIGHDRVRRVILRCDDRPCVFAESFVPEEALALIPNLRNLGGDPLGEALQARPEVTRSAFEYTLLDSLALPEEIGRPGPGPFWARRSSFGIGGVCLLVAEVFLPPITELPR